MKSSGKNKALFSKNNFLWFRYLPLSFLIFYLAFLLLKYPQNSAQGVLKGLDLCLTTLVPSLFPFLVLCSFFVSTGLCEKTGRYFSKFANLIFKQPGVSANVIILSLIGGFPIGSKLISELYDNKQISQIQAQRLMLFCVNAGPAFVISSVGYYMLGSQKIGFIMYLSLTISSLILGFLSRFFLEDDELTYSSNYKVSYDKSASDALVNAVSQGSKSMVSICAWVVVFSCVNELISSFNISFAMSQVLSCILEVTNGCKITATTMPIAVVAGIIGFSGFCVHFQVMNTIVKIKLKYKYFLTARIISAGLAMLICQQLLNYYPQEIEVFSTGSTPTSAFISVSIPVTIGLILMCALLLLGDNYKIASFSDKK